MKRFLTCLVCVLLCACLLPGLFAARAAAERTEVWVRWCGETDEGSIYGRLYSDGELEIFCTNGSGPMNDMKVSDVPWADSRDQILKITVKSGVTYIGDQAFRDCPNLSSVSLPASVTGIGHSAFYGCGKLTSISLPSSLTILEGYSFADCSSLASITIPASVTSIEYNSFQNCTALKSITLPSKLKSLGNEVFLNCTSLKSVKLPASLKTTGYSSGMFKGCTGLTSAGPTGGSYAIQFAWTDAIPSYMFRDSEIQTLKLPAGLKSIGTQSFFNCRSLTSVVIPAGVTEIGDQAFSNCAVLSSVKLPASVTTMGEGVFSYSHGLTSAGPTGGSYSLQFGWTDKIPANAFDGCKDLASVKLPDGIKSIGSEAFLSCEALKSVKLPEGVTEIGKRAFKNCDALADVTIPASVTAIGEEAFYSCSALKTVRISDLNAWCSIVYGGSPGFGYSTPGHKLLLNGTAVTKLVFPAGKTVNDHCFSGCTSLTQVYIPKGVTRIGERAFSTCSSLVSVSIPSGLKTVGTRAFVACNALKDVYYRGTPEQLEKDQILIEYDNTPFEEAKLHCVVSQLPAPELTGKLTSKGKPKLSWGAVEGAVKYQVWRSVPGTDGSFELAKTLTGTSWTDSAAEAGKTYSYKVNALDEFDEQGVSSAVVKLKATAGKPAAPTVKGSLSAKGKPVLSWKAVDGAEKYQVWRSTTGKDGSFKLIKTTTALKFTHTKAIAGKTYYYKVKALTADGVKSTFSAALSLKCRPAAPTVKGTLSAKGKPVLSWKAVDGAEKYQVWRSTTGKDGSFKLIKTTTALKFTHSKATVGKTYYYKVKAVTANGTKSALSSVVTLTCKPVSPTVTGSLSAKGKPVLSWKAVDGAEKYQIWRSTAKDGTYKLIKTMTALKFTNTKATAGETYYYKVRAVTADGVKSAYSTVVKLTAK